MLKKDYRLSSLPRGGAKSFSCSYFSVKVAKNNLDISRFAFVVSKKIDKRATSRNYVKIKIRSIIEEVFDKIKGGFDFVFYPKQTAIKATREQVQEELEDLFEKNQLLKK